MGAIQIDRGVEQEEVELEIGLMGIHREKGGLKFARIERKTPVLRQALQLNQDSLRGLLSSSY